MGGVSNPLQLVTLEKDAPPLQSDGIAPRSAPTAWPAQVILFECESMVLSPASRSLK